MATLSYEDYLKRVNSGMLDANGRFVGPQGGVNYMLEGQTPQEAYANAQAIDMPEIDGRDNAAMNASRLQYLDPTWRDGPAGTGLLNAVGHLAGEVTKNPALMAGVFGGAAQYFNVPGFTGEQGFSGIDAAGSGFSAAKDTGLLATGGDVAALNGNQIAALSPAASANGFSFAVPEAMTNAVGLDLGGVATTAIPGEAAAAGFSGIGSGAGGGAGIGSGTVLGGGGAAAGGGGLLSKVKDFVTDPSNLLKVGGTVLAAAGGAAASKDSTTSKSSTNEPWAEAKPYLLDNLKTNAAMQEHYRANPFSDLQKQQYQGLFDSLANSKANVPGLLANANSFSQSRRGQMPAMQGLLSGTQAAPINFAQYQNIGRKG